MQFSIVSLNTFNSIPEPFRYNGLNSRSERFAEAFYHSLGSEIDIICLQEFMWKRAEILKGFDKHPYVTPIMRSSLFTTNVRLIQSGLCILSKHPITDVRATIFNGPCYHVERLCAKGALYAKIQYDNKINIHVINTHLNAWTGEQADRARESQIQHIVKWMQTLQIPMEEPLFLAGDFNIDVYEHADILYHLMQQLNCFVPLPKETSFSFDPATNPLVGLDAPDEYATLSQKAGCANEYFLHGTCPCCPRQLVDLIACSKSHHQAEEIKVEVVPIKSITPFEIKIRIGVQRNIQYVSDHNAIVLRCFFPNCSSYIIDIPDKTNISQTILYDEPRYEWTCILLQIVLTLFFTLLLLLVLLYFK